MITQSVNEDCPVAIRYSKTLNDNVGDFCGKWNVVKSAERPRLAILAVGSRMLNVALQTATDQTEVVDVTTVKPLDTEFFNGISEDVEILTLEENVIRGGFGESVLSYLTEQGKRNFVRIMGVSDSFVNHASVDEQIALCGLDSAGIAKVIAELLK